MSKGAHIGVCVDDLRHQYNSKCYVCVCVCNITHMST